MKNVRIEGDKIVSKKVQSIEDYFEENLKGRWIKAIDQTENKCLYFITEKAFWEYGELYCRAIGFNWEGKFKDDQINSWGSVSERFFETFDYATEEEVLERFYQEAKRRGLTGGNKYTDCDGVTSSSYSDRCIFWTNQRDRFSIALEECKGLIYSSDGGWAKPAPVEKTYGFGDRFRDAYEEYILCQPEANKVNLINLKDGNRWTDRAPDCDFVRYKQKEVPLSEIERLFYVKLTPIEK